MPRLRHAKARLYHRDRFHEDWFYRHDLYLDTTLEAAEKLVLKPVLKLVAKVALKGHDFSRAAKANKRQGALAPEVR